MTFQLKTILGVALIEGFLLLLLLVSSSQALESSFSVEIEKRATTTVALLNTTARDAILSSDLATLETFVQHAISIPDVAYTRIKRADGLVLAEAGDLAHLATKPKPDTVESPLTDGVFDSIGAVEESGVVYAYIEVGLSTANATLSHERSRERNLIIALVEMLLVAIFSYLLGRYLVKELNRLKEAAAAISEGDYGYQVEVTGTDELADTIKSFNMMSQQIAGSRAIIKESERRALDSARRLDGILTTISEGLFLLDDAQRVLYCNPVADKYLRSLRDTQDQGAPISSLGAYRLSALLNERSHEKRDLTITIGDAERIFEFRAAQVEEASALEWVVVIEDVTLARQAQSRLRAQDRLQAVGQLAAGIAHDFNNILGIIRGLCDLNLERDDEELNEELREDLLSVRGQTVRASELIRQILDFSRRDDERGSALELHGFIAETVKMLQRIVPSSVTLSFSAEEGEAWVFVNPTLLQQIFTNLVVNAVDAMPLGGSVSIELIDLLMSPDASAEGSWVRINVADTGQGISEQHIAHIFEPFYTTKPRGKGTGLGLAQASELIKQHNGEISVESTLGEGTCFTILLPASRSERVLIASRSPAPRSVRGA